MNTINIIVAIMSQHLQYQQAADIGTLLESYACSSRRETGTVSQ